MVGHSISEKLLHKTGLEVNILVPQVIVPEKVEGPMQGVVPEGQPHSIFKRWGFLSKISIHPKDHKVTLVDRLMEVQFIPQKPGADPATRVVLNTVLLYPSTTAKDTGTITLESSLGTPPIVGSAQDRSQNSRRDHSPKSLDGPEKSSGSPTR